MYLVIIALGALVCEVAIRMRLRFVGRGLDVPGHRSLHAVPTPHGGGIGIVVAALLAGALAGVHWSWLAGLLILAAISIVDDWRPLPFWVRLAVHLGVALTVVFLHASYGLAGVFVSTLLIAWAVNAYNFMDGADGLAGSMAASGFAAYAIGFFWASQTGYGLLCLAVVVSAVVFLRFNWNPARIFMGDVGSIPLGFLAGGLGWYGVATGVWPVWYPLLAFSPFLCDASVTLMRRAIRRERVWEAHRDHYYQRMVRMGLSHASMCRRWLFMMLGAAALAVAALVLLPPGGGWLVLGGWGGAMVAFAVAVDRSWSEFKDQK